MITAVTIALTAVPAVAHPAIEHGDAVVPSPVTPHSASLGGEERYVGAGSLEYLGANNHWGAVSGALSGLLRLELTCESDGWYLDPLRHTEIAGTWSFIGSVAALRTLYSGTLGVGLSGSVTGQAMSGSPIFHLELDVDPASAPDWLAGDTARASFTATRPAHVNSCPLISAGTLILTVTAAE